MTSPIYFAAVVTRGVPLLHDGLHDHLALDLAGCRTTGDVPLVIGHAPYAVAGRVGMLKVEDGALAAYGWLDRSGWPASAVLGAVAGGLAWRCSVGVRKDGFKTEHIATGPTAWFNGRGHTTPLNVAREWHVGEVSLTLDPYEPGTSIQFGGRFATSGEELPPGEPSGAADGPGRTRAPAREKRPMPAYFVDHRGYTWELDLEKALLGPRSNHSSMAEAVLKLAAEPGGFAELLANPEALAAVIAMFAGGPEGELGIVDAGLRGWLADPQNWLEVCERVVPALAEAVVAFHRYRGDVVDLVSRAAHAAVGTDEVGQASASAAADPDADAIGFEQRRRARMLAMGRNPEPIRQESPEEIAEARRRNIVKTRHCAPQSWR